MGLVRDILGAAVDSIEHARAARAQRAQEAPQAPTPASPAPHAHYEGVPVSQPHSGAAPPPSPPAAAAPKHGGGFLDNVLERRQQGRGPNDRRGLFSRAVEGAQKLRQEGGLYSEGEEPRPDLEKSDNKSEASAGQPLDPANQLSKKRSYFGVLLLGFIVGSDWIATLVSVQALYYLLQGPKRMFGLAFAIYDLAALLGVVVFSAWSQKAGRFKLPMLLGAAISMAGNFVYAFTMLADTWWFILIARAVAGFGAGVVHLGPSYFAATTGSYGENDVKDTRYRGFQQAGQQIMMLVGMIFLKVGTLTEQSSTWEKLFNFYTLQGWLLAVLTLFVLAPFWLWLFEDPTVENEHLLKKEEDEAGEPTPQQEAKLSGLTRLLLPSAFITIFGMVGFLSNLFALAAGQYHTVSEQKDLFHPFLPVGLGGLGAGIVYKAALGKGSRLKLTVPPFVADERLLIVVCNLLLFAAWMLTIPWCGETCRPAPALFYAGAACVGVASSLFPMSLQAFAKRKQAQYRAVQRARGSTPLKLMGPLMLAAKFLGPLVIGIVTYMATPAGDMHVCTGFISDDLCMPDTATGTSGAAALEAFPNQQCIVLGDQYYVEGCILYNAIYMYPAMAGLQLANCLLAWFTVSRHWSYQG